MSVGIKIMNKNKHKIFFTFSFLFFIFCYVNASSWQMFRGDITRSGSKYEVLVPSMTPYGWEFNVHGEIVGSAVIKNDVVYFGCRDSSVWAVDAFTGEAVWQYSTDDFVDSTPVLYEGYLYVLSRDGKMYCFKRLYKDGEDVLPVWSYDTKSKSYSSPIVVKDKVFFVSGPKNNGLTDGYLYVLNAFDGTLIKNVSLGIFSYASVSYEKEKIFFATNSGQVGCYDILADNIVWIRNNLGSFNYSAITIKDNVVYYYCADMDRKVYALDSTNGDIIWQSVHLSSSATDNTSVSIYENKIFVNVFPTSVWETVGGLVRSSQTIYCINRSNGNILWKKDFFVSCSPKDSYGVISAPIVVNDMIYFGTLDGNFYCLDINTQEEIVKYNLGSGIVCSPTISNGWIYFGTLGGKFFGIKGDKILAIKVPDSLDAVINNSKIEVVSSKFDNENYLLEYSIDGNSWTKISTGTLVSGTTTIFFWDTTLLSDGDYMVKKTIYNSTHNFTVNNIIIDNSPFPPTNITAIIYDSNKIQLSWTKSVDDSAGNNDVMSYEIYRSTLPDTQFVLIGNVNSGVEKYVDTLVQKNTYYYKIMSVDRRSKSVPTQTLGVYVSKSLSMQNQVVGNITSSGGSVVLNQGGGKSVELIFPQDSVEDPVVVKISVLNQYDDTSISAGTKGTGLVYEIDILNQDLTKKVELKKFAQISIKYDETDVVGLDKTRLRIFWYDEEFKKWRLLDTSTSLYNLGVSMSGSVSAGTQNVVIANISKNGIFRVMEYSPLTDEILLEEHVYTYPSPAKGNEVNFKFIIYQPATVKVYVYNVAGDVVWQSEIYEYSLSDIGRTQVIKWDIKKIASGMYIFRLEAKNNSKTKNVIKKMAIIH